MRFRLIRHATLWLEYAGARILVDPMFSEAGANPPIQNSGDERRNPLVPLPEAADAWLAPDLVLVTHLHRDHWDEAAAAALPKTTPVFCQPGDGEAIGASGYSDVTQVDDAAAWRGIGIHRTGGRHGTGEIGLRMGRVSGFVLQAEGEPTLYIAGDTIWCEEVRDALDAYRPDIAVVNAGGARFAAGDPITMDDGDVVALAGYAPHVRIVAVHMDAINHCRVTRQALRKRLQAENLLQQVRIPEDGEWLALNAADSGPDDIVLSTDRDLLDLAYTCRYLQEHTYWAKNMTLDVFRRAVTNSALVVAVYRGEAGGQPIGFARVVSDLATFAYLSDVFVVEEYRGRGISKRMVDFIVNHPDLQGLRRFLLVTLDAQGLYAQFGFKPLTDRAHWMQIRGE